MEFRRVFFRSCHDGDTCIDCAQEWFSEQISIGYSHNQAIGVGGNSLLDQRSCLFQIKLIRSEGFNLNTEAISSRLNALLNNAPETIPGTQRMVNGNNFYRAFGIKFSLKFIYSDETRSSWGDRHRWQNPITSCLNHGGHRAKALIIGLLIDNKQN